MNDAISSSIIIPGSTTRTISAYYDDELTLIHRSYKQKEIEWSKQRIKMEQKIEFLEIQLREINDREANLKNLNNSIMTAFNDISKERDVPNSKIPKEIEILNDQHTREVFEIKRRYEKTIRDLDHEKDEYKKSLMLSLEEKSRMEKDIKHLSEKNLDYEQRFLKWDENIYLRERHIKESIDTENGVKLKDLRNEMVKLKEIHSKEKELLELASQKNMETLKSAFEQEKKLLLGKMDALKEEISILNKNNTKSNSIYEELKGKMNEEVQMIRRQKEELGQKFESAMNNNQQLKFQIKENEQSFDNRLKNFRDEKILAQEEIKRLKQTISDNQNKIKKIEHSEKTLRTLLNEKESYVDEEKNDLKKKLFHEKKKNEQMMDFANKIKDEYNKKHAFIVQEILNKEEEIKKLRQTISKMTNSARRLDKSQEKSPFRTSCYHQQCTAKTNTIENFFDHNYSNHNTSKPNDELRHCCSCNEQSRIENNDTKNIMTLYNCPENTQKSPKEITTTQQNKSVMGSEKNYDLPLQRDPNHFESNKSTLTLSNNNNNFIQNNNTQNQKNTQNQSQTTQKKTNNSKTQANQKDYSKKLTSMLNKENEISKTHHRPKKLTFVDTNKSLLLETSHDYSTVKTNKEVSTTKSKFPSKSPKFTKKPELIKRNRSVSKHEKNCCSINPLPQINELTSNNNMETKALTPTNNHLTINNMIGVLNLPTSIECTICKKIVVVTDFVEHLNQCAGIYVENPSDSNNIQSHTIFSDISNIQHNLSFNTSSEIPEVEKKMKYNQYGTIHESIPNEKALNRKMDENFFSLAPGLVLDADLGSFMKNESNRYADSPSAINMTNEFSTSHKKGFMQENLVNTSFVIKSMNEIKRHSKK